MNQKDKWYGFTEDKVFGWVMDNKDFCKYVIQAVLPDLKIAEVMSIDTQKEINRPKDVSKDVRLDVLVKDTDGRLYDIEMQVANNGNLGERIRYYQSRLDSFALEAGHSYNDLKETYIIFLCDFDYFHKKRMRYSFHLYEDKNKSIKLFNNAINVIINAKGSAKGQRPDLIGLVNLMNGKFDESNPHLAYAKQEIEEINKDPQRRKTIMEYETKLLEVQQEGERKGVKIGEKNILVRVAKRMMQKGNTKEEILEELSALNPAVALDEDRQIVDEVFASKV